METFKPFSDPHPLVSRLCDKLQLNDPNINEVNYLIHFFSCQSTLTKSEKRKAQRKHKNAKAKQALCKK